MTKHVSLSNEEARQLLENFEDYMKGLDVVTSRRIRMKRLMYFSYLGLRNTVLQNILLDDEASFSITEASFAEQTSVMIKQLTSNRVQSITDATACVGGNAINFALHFRKVTAFEVDETRAKYFWHNIGLLCRGRRISVYQADCTDTIAKLLTHQDLVFFDPPWGGHDYKKAALDSVHLFLSGKDLATVCIEWVPYARYIALKVPYNFAFTAFFRKTWQHVRRLHTQPMGESRDGVPKFVFVLLQRVGE